MQVIAPSGYKTFEKKKHWGLKNVVLIWVKDLRKRNSNSQNFANTIDTMFVAQSSKHISRITKFETKSGLRKVRTRSSGYIVGENMLILSGK